jgi:hypothetical protein
VCKRQTILPATTVVEHYRLHRLRHLRKNGLHQLTRRQKWNMTNRSSRYIRHPNARNCRRKRGNSPDLMLCDGLWKVLCISTWRLFYAFFQAVVEKERRVCRAPAGWYGIDKSANP